MRRLREAWQGFKAGAWLGWQIESNWTEPFLFAIYSVIKPVAGVLILVFMYLVVAQGGLGNPLFPQVFLGTTFYLYVVNVLSGISWSVHDDREHYGMLKYVYMAPLHLYGYLLGRGAAKTLVATVSVLITLAFGMAFLKVRLSLGSPGLLVAALGLGLAALAFYGILLAGVSLLIARHGWMVGDVVAGGFYLLCGAAFPLALLPAPFRALGLGLPPTYWFEALRRALLGAGLHPELAALSDAQLLLILAGSTLLGVALSAGLFRAAERIAVRRGLLDMQTMY
ncbi:MAG: ABC transporter permease [Candidatus Bipolaricaulaceae bacterium]